MISLTLGLLGLVWGGGGGGIGGGGGGGGWGGGGYNISICHVIYISDKIALLFVTVC